MKITHRAAPAPAVSVVSELPLTLLGTSEKAPRLSCCCRLSELMPMVRQLHDEARAARLAGEEQPGVAA